MFTVVPAIYEKLPRYYREIFIKLQQENAPVQIELEHHAFLVTARTTGLDIHLVCQTPAVQTLM